VLPSPFPARGSPQSCDLQPTIRSFTPRESKLFDPRRFESFPRAIDKKVFENELAFAAVQRAAAATTLNPAI